MRRLEERTITLANPDPHVDESWLEVEEAISALDPDRREAFVLTQLFGFSYEDAAAAVGCPIGTIRSRVARARADLLEAIESLDQRTA
jgi:RNA polymerase sigma-70 factor (ECF subfamily)